MACPMSKLIFCGWLLMMTSAYGLMEGAISASEVKKGTVIYHQTLDAPAVVSGFYTRLANALGPPDVPVTIGLKVNGILRSERAVIPIFPSPLYLYTQQNGLSSPPLDVGQEYRTALISPVSVNVGDSVSLEIISCGTLKSGIVAGVQCQGVYSLDSMREPFRAVRTAGPVSRYAWSAREVICTGNQISGNPYCAPQNNSGVVLDSDGTLYQFTSFYSVDEQYGGGRGGSIARIFGFRKNVGGNTWDSLGLLIDPVPDGLAYAGDPFAFRDLDGTPCIAYSTVNGTNGFSNWTLIDGRILKSTTKSFAGPWVKYHALFTGYPRGTGDAGRAICLRVYPRPATHDYLLLWQHGGQDITIRGKIISTLEATLTNTDIDTAPNLVRNQEEGGGGFVYNGKGYLSTWQIPQINDPTGIQRLYEFDLASPLNPEHWRVVPGSVGFNDGMNPVEDGGVTADAWSLSMVGEELWATAVMWSVTNSKNSILACHVPWTSRVGNRFQHGVSRVTQYRETAPVVEYALGKQCALECQWTGYGSLSYCFLFIAPSARNLYYGGIALEISDKGSRLAIYSTDGSLIGGLTPYTAPSYVSGTTYQIKFQRDDNVFTGWVNGVKIGSATITEANQLAALSEPVRFKFYGYQGGRYEIKNGVLSDGLPHAEETWNWFDVKKDSSLFDLEGKAFNTGATYYSRVPTQYSAYPFYALSNNTSGFAARFATNSKKMAIRWSLTNPELGLTTNGGSGVYYGPSGVSGVSVYQRAGSAWIEVGSGVPTGQNDNIVVLSLLGSGSKECLVYFPLYNGITKFEVGVDSGSSFTKAFPRPAEKKPMVFYGTSITQGACASHPGWTTAARVARALDYPMVDMGFSNSGLMEVAAAEMLSAIDASIYIVDCVWNMKTGTLLADRPAPFFTELRKNHPTTPIVFVDATDKDGITPTSYGLMLQQAIENIKISTGDTNVYFLARDFIGNDGAGVVDGIHLSDTGFARQGRCFISYIDSLLQREYPHMNSPVIIETESAMRDSLGQVITDCVEPHIFKFGDTWYAYGFSVRTAATATTCYSSKDLKSWTLSSSYPWSGGWNGGNLFLWYVIYNAKNNEYVGFSAVYGDYIYISISPTPEGPFTYQNRVSAVYGGPGDILVYQDTDNKAYLIYNKFQGDIPSRKSFIYQLNEDYYDIIPSTLCNTNAVMEGFWMIKQNNTYFLLGSGLVSYDVDDNFYLTAPSPLGPWTNRGYFAPVGSKTFSSQTFQGLSVSGSKGTAHIFIGHRWNALGPVNGAFPKASSIWLPLIFDSDTSIQQMKWYDTWQLDTAGAIVTPQATQTKEPGVNEETLLSIFPNPANPSCRISLTLTGNASSELSIQDLTGRLVKRFDLSGLKKGRHDVVWDASDLHGAPVASGVYVCKWVSGDCVLTHKLVLAR